MSGSRLDADARQLLDDIFDKWSLLVLDELCSSPRRFNQLRRSLPVVTAKSLSQALRRLEDNGIVERRVLSTRPLAVEYAITAQGRSLEEPLRLVLAWVVAHGGAAGRSTSLQAEQPSATS